MRKGALGEAERDPWTQETSEDRREAGSETKPENADPETQATAAAARAHRGGVRSQALPGTSPFMCLVRTRTRTLGGPCC